MKLRTIEGSDTEIGIGMQFEAGGENTIIIACEDALEDARRIGRAVNCFDALVSALTPFRSSEMGDLLVNMIDIRESQGEDAQKRLSQLIKMIDVILDVADPENEDANAADA